MPKKERRKIFSVLLVNPSLEIESYSREDRLRTYLSLGTLASALRSRPFIEKFIQRSPRFAERKRGMIDEPLYEVWVLNLSLRKKDQALREYFESFFHEKEFYPQLIGMSATSAQLDEAKEISELAKQFFSDALRVIGGPHASVVPHEILRETAFQVACIGEGVETLLDLVLAFSVHGIRGLENVSGIAYKDDSDAVHSNPPRKLLFHLDEYPFPSDSLDLWLDDLQDRDKNNRDLIYLLAGSGCPYRCVFCAQHAIHRGRIRERSAENIFAEMKRLSEKGFRKFAIVQETFLRDPERVGRVCSLIENSGVPFEWTIEARADQLTHENLARMKRAGLCFVQMGVESGDQELLNTLGKNISLDQVIRVRDWCEDLEIDTAFYLLVGLPEQGWQSILRSAIFLKEHTPFNRITRHISTAVAIPYPGTEIYERKTVRIVGMPTAFLNWPGRNCKVEADEAGVFIGQNFTETDAMASGEILEAYTCLDDLGEFLLQAKYNPGFSPEERFRAREFAWQSFHMIGRRTIRDLIIRAQPDLSPGKYCQARDEILIRDRGQEAHLKDLAPSAEPWPEVFSRFLAAVKFQNGFQTMKVLTIPNRIKWMKACAALWAGAKQNLSQIRFAADGVKEGARLNDFLENIPAATIDGFMERIGQKQDPKTGTPDGSIDLMGLIFDFFAEKYTMTVRIIDQGGKAVP
jgi:anaerobic magnesium-protoporphyrin IX monomethyl ester cyclase